MTEPIKIQKKDYNRLKRYFQQHEVPYIRPSRPKDDILYIGVADEELYYVSSTPLDFESDYSEVILNSCIEGQTLLLKHLPSLSICTDGKVVCQLELEDNLGLFTKIITFRQLLAVSLLQQYFDDHEIPIVFAPDNDEWTLTEKEADEMENESDLPNRLEELMKTERQPIGDELCRTLQEWYPCSTKCINRGNYSKSVFNFLRWALSGRVQEVLNYLDTSTSPMNKKVAYRIREIGTWDRSGGGMAATMASALYGWLGRELGNLTWTTGDSDWYKYYGDARRALDRLYPEVFRNKVTEGKGLVGIDALVEQVGANSKLFERVYDVLRDSDNPKHRIRAITAVSRIVRRCPGLLGGRIDGLLSSDFKTEPIEFSREVARMISVLNLSGKEREEAINKLQYFLDNFDDEELIDLTKRALLTHANNVPKNPEQDPTSGTLPQMRETGTSGGSLKYIPSKYEFKPLFTCPFCGTQVDEKGKIDCPHFIAHIQDMDLFKWNGSFEILEDIRRSINSLHDEIWERLEAVFEGIPYWENLEVDEIDNISEVLKKHPFIQEATAASPVPCNATVESYYFIDAEKKEEFMAILAIVKTRLDSLNEGATDPFYG